MWKFPSKLILGREIRIRDSIFNILHIQATSSQKKDRKKVMDKMMETHPSNVAFKHLNDDYSVLNRYSYGDEYLTHFDVSSFSAITFFNLGRSEILGGELVFADYDISFKFKDNFCIIFPSWIEHHANKVKSKNIYRYSLSQFGMIGPNKA